jgi:hypothetical protein
MLVSLALSLQMGAVEHTHLLTLFNYVLSYVYAVHD